MRRPLLIALAVLIVGMLAAPGMIAPREAAAHPLGNFTVSRYSRVELTPGLARIRYVVDMAEIPTFQERGAIDANRDGSLDDAEARAYAGRLATAVPRALRLAVNGNVVPLRPVGEPEISFPEGQGGLDTLRFGMWYEGALPALSGATSVEYRDENFADRLGWREIVVRGGPGIDVLNASALETDISNELTVYPGDLLQKPLDRRSAGFEIAPGAGKALDGSGAPAPVARKGDRFADLVSRELTVPVALLSLLIALGLGAVHALGPGHGKGVVAAYLVGSRGTTKHAIFLGLTVTLTHTSSVFALGLVTLFLQDYILPEQLFPWLSFLSGASIAVLGLALLATRTRALLRGRRPALAAAVATASVPARMNAAVLPNAHGRMRHYQPETGSGHTHRFGPGGGHDHGGLGHHSHGGRAHSHMPPGATGERVTWRSLLALGVAGGIIPCPSALVVLLTAISIGRVGYGMLLIVAFSVGLAGALIGIGLLLVHARGLFSRMPVDGLIARALPVVSAAVMATLGVGIAVRALTGGGGIAI